MKIFSGIVTSRKMDKTAVVSVMRVIVHPIYKKRVKRVKKYHVHDEANVTEVGQTIKFTASKPYSKTKRWKLVSEKSGSGPLAIAKDKLKATSVESKVVGRKK